MSVAGALQRLVQSWGVVPLWLRALAPVAVMGTLWFLSSLPPTPAAPSDLRSFLHNGAHVVAYAALATTWLLARQPAFGPAALGGAWAYASIGLSTAYGVVDELHQAYVPGRVSSVLDVLTDLSGGVLALVVVRGMLRRTPWLLLRAAACFVVCLVCVGAATWLPW